VVRILKKKEPAERIKLLRESTNPQAQFVWSILRDSWHLGLYPFVVNN
jgi:3-hydroxyacyl-CoA dehydrogenase